MNKHPHVGLSYPFRLYDPRGRLIDEDEALNLVPIEGMNHALGVLLNGVTPITTWYLAPFQGDYTPVPTITAATFPAAATECTGYAESTRVAYIGSTPVGGNEDNSASIAEFTSNANATLYGIALLGAPGKGATTSRLLSIARFPSPRPFSNGSKLQILCSPSIASGS